MSEFETPSFLQNRSTDDIFAKIKTILPPDIDLSEGGHGWNLTRPIALVGAEICEFILPEVIRLILPEFSYGEILVGHAKSRGIKPNEAVAASGEVTITGTPNSTIPAGSIFSVPSVNSEPSIDYATTEEGTIPESGTLKATVVCTKAGTIGNTPANTIILISSKLTGVSSVTNEEPFDNGTEADSDEVLIERIAEYDKTQGYSFVGNKADYERWAIEAGAGDATCIPPDDDSGVVTLIVTDKNGAPADDTLREKVYNHIISPNNRDDRLAPIGAILTMDSIITPQKCKISIMATVELETGATTDSVKAKFASAMALYLTEALEDEEVKYSRVWAELSAVDGVADFKDLVIGLVVEEPGNGPSVTYGTSNIPISDLQLPTVAEEYLFINSGTV